MIITKRKKNKETLTKMTIFEFPGLESENLTETTKIYEYELINPSKNIEFSFNEINGKFNVVDIVDTISPRDQHSDLYIRTIYLRKKE